MTRTPARPTRRVRGRLGRQSLRLTVWSRVRVTHLAQFPVGRAIEAQARQLELLATELRHCQAGPGTCHTEPQACRSVTVSSAIQVQVDLN